MPDDNEKVLAELREIREILLRVMKLMEQVAFGMGIRIDE